MLADELRLFDEWMSEYQKELHVFSVGVFKCFMSHALWH